MLRVCRLTMLPLLLLLLLPPPSQCSFLLLALLLFRLLLRVHLLQNGFCGKRRGRRKMLLNDRLILLLPSRPSVCGLWSPDALA